MTTDKKKPWEPKKVVDFPASHYGYFQDVIDNDAVRQFKFENEKDINQIKKEFTDFRRVLARSHGMLAQRAYVVDIIVEGNVITLKRKSAVQISRMADNKTARERLHTIAGQNSNAN